MKIQYIFPNFRPKPTYFLWFLTEVPSHWDTFSESLENSKNETILLSAYKFDVN